MRNNGLKKRSLQHYSEKKKGKTSQPAIEPSSGSFYLPFSFAAFILSIVKLFNHRNSNIYIYFFFKKVMIWGSSMGGKKVGHCVDGYLCLKD